MLPGRYLYSLLIGLGYRNKKQEQSKLAKREIKTIIENKMGDRMISIRMFTFAEGNRNIKIKWRC